MPVELNALERELIANLLEKELEDIRSELHHTQNHEYKDNLKEREGLVRDLLARFRG